MDFYSKALEFFIENGINLTSDQLDALQEKTAFDKHPEEVKKYLHKKVDEDIKSRKGIENIYKDEAKKKDYYDNKSFDNIPIASSSRQRNLDRLHRAENSKKLIDKSTAKDRESMLRNYEPEMTKTRLNSNGSKQIKNDIDWKNNYHRKSGRTNLF